MKRQRMHDADPGRGEPLPLPPPPTPALRALHTRLFPCSQRAQGTDSIILQQLEGCGVQGAAAFPQSSPQTCPGMQRRPANCVRMLRWLLRLCAHADADNNTAFTTASHAFMRVCVLCCAAQEGEAPHGSPAALLPCLSPALDDKPGSQLDPALAAGSLARPSSPEPASNTCSLGSRAVTTGIPGQLEPGSALHALKPPEQQQHRHQHGPQHDQLRSHGHGHGHGPPGSPERGAELAGGHSRQDGRAAGGAAHGQQAGATNGHAANANGAATGDRAGSSKQHHDQQQQHGPVGHAAHDAKAGAPSSSSSGHAAAGGAEAVGAARTASGGPQYSPVGPGPGAMAKRRVLLSFADEIDDGEAAGRGEAAGGGEDKDSAGGAAHHADAGGSIGSVTAQRFKQELRHVPLGLPSRCDGCSRHAMMVLVLAQRARVERDG